MSASCGLRGLLRPSQYTFGGVQSSFNNEADHASSHLLGGLLNVHLDKPRVICTVDGGSACRCEECHQLGQVLGTLTRRQGSPVYGDDPLIYLGLNLGLKKVEDAQVRKDVVARDGVEPPTPAFSDINSDRKYLEG